MINMPQESLKVFKSGAQQVLSHPTWDLVLVLFFAAAGFFYGISAGKRRVVSALLYTYVTIAIFPLVPIEFIARIFNLKTYVFIKSTSFLFIFFALYFFLGSKRFRLGISKGDSLWQTFLLSFLQIGLLLHSFFSFLPQEKIKLLAPVTQYIFADPRAKFWWYLLPLATLLVIKRLGKEE